MFGGQYGLEADTCKKRGVVVGYDNTCRFFIDRRAFNALEEAQKTYNKFKELDESGFR